MSIRKFRPTCSLRLAALGLLGVVCGSLSDSAAGQGVLPEPAPPTTLVAAQRSLELAELRLLRYDRVEYPLAQRRLENEIEMTQLEIESWKRRIREYERFSRNSYSTPFFYTLEENRLALKDAELRLDMLRRERCLNVQFKGTIRRIRELEVEQSRDWIQRLSK